MTSAPDGSGRPPTNRPRPRWLPLAIGAAVVVLTFGAAGMLASRGLLLSSAQATVAQTSSGMMPQDQTERGGSPSPAIGPQPSTTSPTPGSGSGTGITKDVTTMGATVDGSDPISTFTSPTGNLICNLSSSQALCWAVTYDAGAQPACPDEPGKADFVYIENYGDSTQQTAEWGCFEFGGNWLLDEAPDVDWWDPAIGTTVSVPDGDKMAPAAALRYGNTLISGDNHCTMAKDGVTCWNTHTERGFHLNRSGATLH